MRKSNQPPKADEATRPLVFEESPVFADPMAQLRFQIIKSLVIRNLRRSESESETRS